MMGLRCPECVKVFNDLKSLRSHFIKSHRQNYCRFCNKQIKNDIMHFMMKKDDYHFLYLLLLRGLSWLPKEERGVAQALIEKMLFDGRRR
jgi:uncharacterized C2H2 Zn-finger protein